MIRLFIEGQELDVNEGFTHQITYAVDDLNNIDSKATSFSKTIVLPGTANNNKLFGNIFDFGNANFTEDVANVGYNFNASKSAKALVEINGLLVMKGVLRLLEIIVDGQNIEYEVALFGELGGFVTKLANKRLQDLDFSQYDHTYNATNIITSWDDNISYTPFLLDIQNNKTIYALDVNINLLKGDTFTITGSTSNNGTFTVVSLTKDIFLGFIRIAIVVEENTIQELGSAGIFNVPKNGFGYFYPLIDYGYVSSNKIDYSYITLRPALYVREYMHKIITEAGYTYQSNFFNTNFFKRLIVPNNDKGFLKKDTTNYFDGTTNVDQSESLTVTSTSTFSKTDLKSKTILFNSPTLSSFTYNSGVFTYTGASNTSTSIVFNFTYNNTITGFYKNLAKSYIRVIKNNAVINTLQLLDGYNTTQIELKTDFKTNDTIKFEIYLYCLVPSGGYNTTMNVTIYSGANVVCDIYPSGFINYAINDSIKINQSIPENIQQKDFFTSIIKMFNLMITEDKDKENHLIIEPWVDFYNLDRTTYIDWSDKLDRSEPIRLKPMSEVNSRYYDFMYKSDSDYYNDLYRKKYNEGYGDRKFDNQLEFAKETAKTDVIFSSTPLVGYEGKDKIVSTIFKWDGTTTDKEEQISSNIRILQAKKIDGVDAWDILNSAPFSPNNPTPITNGNNLTTYGYAGHLDDPDAPNVDLNFGATNELYFELASGALSNNMFNAYYSSYMAEITDKDSRLLTAKFRLTEKDIYNLDFGRFIFVDGVLYRLVKVYDYSEGEVSKVDLLRVIYTTY